MVCGLFKITFGPGADGSSILAHQATVTKASCTSFILSRSFRYLQERIQGSLDLNCWRSHRTACFGAYVSRLIDRASSALPSPTPDCGISRLLYHRLDVPYQFSIFSHLSLLAFILSFCCSSSSVEPRSFPAHSVVIVSSSITTPPYTFFCERLRRVRDQ